MMDVSMSLFVIAFIISLGFFADLFFTKTKIPDVIWLIVFGMLIGPMFKIVDQEALFGIAPLFTTIAIAIILFESGRKMKFGELLQDATSAIVFMIANLVMAILLVALGMTLIFGMGFQKSLLLGVIVAGTSSPMIVTVVDRLGIGIKSKAMMSIESILNSPIVIVIGLVLMNNLSTSQSMIGLNISSDIIKSFIVSITCGLLIGIAWAKALDNDDHLCAVLDVYLISIPGWEWCAGITDDGAHPREYCCFLNCFEEKDNRLDQRNEGF